MNNIKISLLPLALFFLFFSACKKSDDTLPGPGGSVTPASGQWKITYFFDKKDETSNYTGYVFDFGNTGALKASNGSQTWTGTWSSGYDDSANKFLIDFNGSVPSALSELEEDWRILKMDDKLMHFEHVSGGNGDTDVVKFGRQ